MKKKSIKKITLSNLTQVFLLAMLIIIAVIVLSYRSFFQYVVENRVISVSEIIQAGLTSHMKAGIMDKRDYFLEEIASVHDINSIKIIRADAVVEQFGKSGKFEQPLDEHLRTILQEKKVHINWNDFDSKVEAVVPYIANSKGYLNCLECHHVRDGDVLGAVSITIDTSVYQSMVLKNSYLIVGVLLLFALVVILNMSHVIERYIRKPLSNIIEDGEMAYQEHKEVDSDKYESKEFCDVAQNVNKFNKNILSKEEQLQEKNLQLQHLNEEIELTLKETMLAMGQIEELRSGETKRHTQRVAAISILIARAYGLSEEEVKLIELTSPLHDIGKIGIADAILNKPMKLSDEEFTLMKTHASLGHDILKHSKRKVLNIAATIAYEHHEKYDGTGYPRGLKGEEIDIYARIVAVVDVFDALLSKRVYKQQWSLDEVVAFLTKERGKHFDPRIVDIVLENIDECAKIVSELSEEKA